MDIAFLKLVQSSGVAIPGSHATLVLQSKSWGACVTYLRTQKFLLASAASATWDATQQNYASLTYNSAYFPSPMFFPQLWSFIASISAWSRCAMQKGLKVGVDSAPVGLHSEHCDPTITHGTLKHLSSNTGSSSSDQQNVFCTLGKYRKISTRCTTRMDTSKKKYHIPYRYYSLLYQVDYKPHLWMMAIGLQLQFALSDIQCWHPPAVNWYPPGQCLGILEKWFPQHRCT